jgi:UDP-glucose 4-epimerase
MRRDSRGAGRGARDRIRAVKNVLITGGAGFIGSHIADDVLARGGRAIVLDDLSTGRRQNVPEGAVFHQRDLLDPGLDELLGDEKVDVVCHHAAQANVRVSLEDPAADARINVLGGLRLVAACRRAGVRRFVFASSGGTVYGEQERFPCDEEHPKRPTSPYGVAKYSFELYLEAFGRAGDLEPVILRYANVYGPRQWPKGEAGIVAILAEHLLAGERPRIFGDGEQTRDYVHVADVVAANRAAFTTDRLGAYNVGTGVETSVNELYRQVARELGSSIEPLHAPAVRGELRRNSLDAGRIARELGVRIATPLAEGLRSTLAWYRSRAAR